MYNPRKIWLLYAKKLYELLRRSSDEIAVMVRKNIQELAAQYHMALDPDQQQHLLEVGLALFEEEYLEAYRQSSRGIEPEGELTALQSTVIVEETTGYPVTELFKAMVQEIMNDRDKSEEEVADILIQKYGAYPARAILKINLQEAPIPENHVPDLALARAVETVVTGRKAATD